MSGLIAAPAGAGWSGLTGSPVAVWPEESPSAFLPSAPAVRALLAVAPGGGDSVAAADPSAVCEGAGRRVVAAFWRRLRRRGRDRDGVHGVVHVMRPIDVGCAEPPE